MSFVVDVSRELIIGNNRDLVTCWRHGNAADTEWETYSVENMVAN